MHYLKSHLAKLPKLIHAHKYLALFIVILILVVVLAPITYTFISTRNHRYDLSNTSADKIPFHKVGIVFGAGILPDGQPTPYLAYRVHTAVNLYKAHRIDYLLMSGDNSIVTHNEPQVMENYALTLGVPLKAIALDDAGFDTYDTCYRAHALFGLTSATLISQGYHLPRAMTTCKGLGINNIGVIAMNSSRDYTPSYLVREVFSTDKMVFEIAFKPKPPILGPHLPL